MNDQQQAIEVASPPQPLALAESGISVEELVSRVEKVHAVQSSVMKLGVHYGKVPGVNKPTLLKPGAEILGMTFRLAPQFAVERTRDGDHLEVLVTCTLFHAPTGARLGDGVGSCSTRESKYAWRKAERKCPSCGASAIIKGKAEYGGGWVCFKKKSGCGEKFRDGDASIEGQETGRVPNPDIADTYNTVLKMAVKRAHVAAILFVTCASEIFTQDVEDMGFGDGGATDDAHAPRAAEVLTADIEYAGDLAELEEVGARIKQAQQKRTITIPESNTLRAAYRARKDLLESETAPDGERKAS